MKKPFLLLVLLAVGAIATYQFIRLNNDHRECEEKTQRWKNAKGETVMEKQHVCRETFSF